MVEEVTGGDGESRRAVDSSTERETSRSTRDGMSRQVLARAWWRRARAVGDGTCGMCEVRDMRSVFVALMVVVMVVVKVFEEVEEEEEGECLFVCFYTCAVYR